MAKREDRTHSDPRDVKNANFGCGLTVCQPWFGFIRVPYIGFRQKDYWQFGFVVLGSLGVTHVNGKNFHSDGPNTSFLSFRNDFDLAFSRLSTVSQIASVRQYNKFFMY